MPLRTRFKTNYYNSSLIPSFTQTWVGHGTYTVNGNIRNFTDYDIENMRDEPFVKGRPIKEVIHQKKRLERTPIGASTLIQNGETFMSTGTNCFWHEWGIGDHDFLDHKHIPVSWPKSEDELVREAMGKFHDTNEVDSLLNVVESPELVTGIQSLYGQINVPKVAGGAMMRTSKGWRVRPKFQHLPWAKAFRNGVGVLSGGFLYYSFGIAPLINDMRKLGKSSRTFLKDIERIARQSGQVRSYRAKCLGQIPDVLPLEAEQDISLPGFATGPLRGGYWTAQLDNNSEALMSCTIRGVRDQRQTTDLSKKISAVVDRFVGVGPASFLWERIPFSFVADWFLDFSSVLNAADNLLTGNRKNIKDICISYKWDVLGKIYKIQRQANETSGADGTEIARCKLRYYHRHSVLPTLSIGRNDRFGKRQKLLSGALLGQKAANLKRLK